MSGYFLTLTLFLQIGLGFSALKAGLSGVPFVTAQKRQRRVQESPRIRKTAVPREKHSPRLGQRASWQTVWRRPSSRRERIREKAAAAGV